MNKIIYITSTSFLDSDLPLLRELEKHVELLVIIDLPSFGLKSTVLNLESQPKNCGILSIEKIILDPVLRQKFPKNTYFLNRPKAKMFSKETWKSNVVTFRFIRQHGADLVHINNPLQIQMWSIFLLKIKKILTIHDPLPHLGESKQNLFYKWLSLKLIKKIVLLNDSQKNAFEKKYKIKSKNVDVTGLSVINADKDFDKVQSTNDILFFGRITPYKGIPVLVDAFKRLQVPLPNVKMIIAGKGPIEEEWKHISNLEIRNKHIPLDELKTLISTSKIVVCPYIEATQSGVIMSAFAFNKPVIASNVGGLAEMVIHGKTGLIVTPNDPNELFVNLLECITNEQLLNEFSANIDKLYSLDGEKGWVKIAEKTLAVYNK